MIGQGGKGTLAEWVDLLARDEPTSAAAWHELQRRLAADHVPLADALWDHLEEPERDRLLSRLLALIIQATSGAPRLRLGLYDYAEAMGIHFFRTQYSSPIPDSRTLGPHVWTRRWDDAPGFSWNREAQLGLLGRLQRWAEDLATTPMDRPADETQYYFNNGVFGPLDAIVYYGMVREFAPRTVIEVGSGYSTLIAAQAARATGRTALRAIEPFPPPFLARGIPGLTALIRRKVQDVSSREFETLTANDILFIDGTHVSRIDSDVNHLMLGVLPRLAPGVLVHFHDIHLPWDYHQGLLRRHKRFWNEQYLVLAFLLFNRAFRVVWASCYLAHEESKALRSAFPFAPALMGSSLWIQRTA